MARTPCPAAGAVLGQNLATLPPPPGPCGRPAPLPCPAAVPPAVPAPVAPLSHHEILGLVEPFTRRGRQLDLAASDRAARTLVFKPLDHPAAGETCPALRETLQLEGAGAGRWRLKRLLTLPGGLQSALEAEGPVPAELLARVAAIPLQRQVLAGPGFVLAKQLRLEPRGPLAPEALADEAALAAAPVLMHQATAQLDGLRLQMKVSPVKGISGEIDLEPTADEALDLPDDLLAVLGWSWARLIRRQHGWTTRLRLRGEGYKRCRDAETKLERAVHHLARTLAEPPARFHDQRVGARWAVVARRTLPLLGSAAMIAAAGLFAKLEPDLAQDSVFRMLIFHAPPILLVILFSLNELPRVEIPPLPRRPRGDSWRRPRTNAVSA